MLCYVMYIGCIVQWVHVLVHWFRSHVLYDFSLSRSPSSRKFFSPLIWDNNGQKHSEPKTEKFGNVLITKLKLCVQLCACAVSACAMCIDNIMFFYSKHFKSSKNSIFLRCIRRSNDTGSHQSDEKEFLLIIHCENGLNILFDRDCCVQVHFARECNVNI